MTGSQGPIGAGDDMAERSVLARIAIVWNDRHDPLWACDGIVRSLPFGNPSDQFANRFDRQYEMVLWFAFFC